MSRVTSVYNHEFFFLNKTACRILQNQRAKRNHTHRQATRKEGVNFKKSQIPPRMPTTFFFILLLSKSCIESSTWPNLARPWLGWRKKSVGSFHRMSRNFSWIKSSWNKYRYRLYGTDFLRNRFILKEVLVVFHVFFRGINSSWKKYELYVADFPRNKFALKKEYTVHTENLR